MFSYTTISESRSPKTISDLNYDPTVRFYRFKDLNVHWYNFSITDQGIFESSEEECMGRDIVDISTPGIKIIDHCYLGFFHMIFDGLLQFFGNRNFFINNDVELIIDIAHKDSWPYADYVFELNKFVYEKLGIKYRIINTIFKDGIKCSTMLPLRDHFPTNIDKQAVIDFNSFMNEKLKLGWEQEEPTKKIYISRLKYDNDLPHARVKNERVLEEYMKNKGYEIVYAEEFNSIFDQIRFMSKVKTLVSPTSSGITNALFMKPGGNILELTTSFQMLDREDLHHQYVNLAYSLNHNYHAIQNKDRNADIIINKLEKTNILNIL